MEGGAVDFNGAGTVLTTTSCLLNKNRNPRLSKRQIERYLKDYYGQQHVVWLGDGIEGDDTDGHIDDLARFVDARTIVIGMEDDPRDPNYKVLRDNRRLLDRAARSGRPRRSTIVELPMPRPVRYQGQRLPATYMNFYFVNGALLVPTFGQARRDERGARDPAAPAAPPHGRRRRLPRAHLGPRRDSLPDAAATCVVIDATVMLGGTALNRCRDSAACGSRRGPNSAKLSGRPSHKIEQCRVR